MFRVAAVYGGSAFVVLQVVDVVAEGLALSPLALQVVTVLILAGFPIALGLAWAFEVTPDGVRRTDPAAQEAIDEIAGLPRTRRWLSGALGLLGGIAIATAGWWALGPRPAGQDPSGEVSPVPASEARAFRASLAVLPFVNRSDDPANEYFTDGVHDDILAELSRLEDLKLISRTSVMRYRGSEASIREIGQELGVATVLEGSVQRLGERVRITAQLIDAATDNHLWAQTYDQELTAANVFAIQTDVARKIASALEARLVGDAPKAVRGPPTESLEAYDRLTEARFLLATRDAANMLRAVDLYREAIALDSTYALAHAGLAEAHLILFSWNSLSLEEVRQVVEPSLQRALALNPELGEAYALRGLYYRNLGRFEESEASFLRAAELVPGHAHTHHWFGILLFELGRFDESRAELRLALALDPLSRIINTNVGVGEFFARNYETAVAQYLRALDRFPDFDYTWIQLSDAYSLSGRHEEAIRAARRSLELTPGDKNWTPTLAHHLALAGDEQEARRILDSLGPDSDPTRIAIAHVALGDRDEAFRWLERAFEVSSPFISELRDPRYDPIRDDPRFQDMLQRANLVD